MIESIMSGSLIRETPPWARMSAGTRSRAITATAPASSAILAWSAVTTSMITPPLSISAMPRLTREVPVCGAVSVVVSVVSAMPPILRRHADASLLGERPCGQRLAPHLQHPVAHRVGAGHGQHPERGLVEDRQPEDVAEEREHQDRDQP